jgi:hypothetical protein
MNKIEQARARRVKALADIIQRRVSYFNGWIVYAKTDREECEYAAKEILRRVERWKR